MAPPVGAIALMPWMITLRNSVRFLNGPGGSSSYSYFFAKAGQDFTMPGALGEAGIRVSAGCRRQATAFVRYATTIDTVAATVLAVIFIAIALRCMVI
jgi:hypothetical protein